MRKPLSRRLALFLLISLCLGLAGCASPSEADKTNAAEVFLTEFFCFNHQERYDRFSEALRLGAGGQEAADLLLEERQQAYEESCRPLAEVATQSCLDTLQANRLPLKYDMLAVQEGISAQPDTVSCTLCEENTVHFAVSFRSEEANAYFHAPVEGELTLVTVDGQVRVDSILIS